MWKLRTSLAYASMLLIEGCAADTRSLQVYLLEDPNGRLRGFSCRRDDGVPDTIVGEPLVESFARARRLSVIFDFLRLDEFEPSCREFDLVHYCRVVSTCSTFRASRTCLEFEAPPDACSTARGYEFAHCLLKDTLRPQGITLSASAPDDLVALRAVATVQSCDEFAAEGVDFDDLVGCVYSCPMYPDIAPRELSMSFNSASEECAPAVFECAALGSP